MRSQARVWSNPKWEKRKWDGERRRDMLEISLRMQWNLGCRWPQIFSDLSYLWKVVGSFFPSISVREVSHILCGFLFSSSSLTAWDKDNTTAGVGVHKEQCLLSKRQINRGWLFRKKKKKEKSSIANEFNSSLHSHFFSSCPISWQELLCAPSMRTLKTPDPIDQIRG